MLFAKINPPSSIAKQIDAFSYDVIEGHYMTASAVPYILGSGKTSFQVFFGNFTQPVPESEPAVVPFNIIYTMFIELTAEQLSTWGNNDEDALTVIANFLNVEILEFKDAPDITRM